MPAIFFPERRDEAIGNNYPFADDARLTARDGLSLDPDMLLDASVYPIGGLARQGVTEIVVANRLVTFWIGDPRQAHRASVSFDPLAPPALLALSDPLGRAVGVLVADPLKLAAAQTWSLGSHTFVTGAAEFAASCTIASPAKALEAIKVGNTILAGDVWIVGDDGVVVRDEEGDIRIDIVGDPLYARRLCQPFGLFVTPQFIRTITVEDEHGVRTTLHPDELGDIRFTVGGHAASDTILRITPAPPDAVEFSAAGRQA